MPSLQEFRFRSNPSVELKQLGELTAEQHEQFRELESDSDFYGLFVAKPPLTMNLKSVARQTAQLFLDLTTPSHLDHALLDDAEYSDDVIDLLLDGILEIESGGDFVSGADALPIVCRSPAVPEPHDAVARLSRAALLYAQDLETSDAHALTTALYFYNRIPMSPFWKSCFASRDAILAHLGADRGSLRMLLEREWNSSQPANGWLSWTSKTAMPRDAGRASYKLYVSPRPERIRDAFEIVVRVLCDVPGIDFKIGDSAKGMLRPDKFVAYFETRGELDEVATALAHNLGGCDAHGVPFTAGLDESGLLSWGVDPPENDRALRWLERESWRVWVVQRLGAAMSVAKRARRADAVEPWRFAMERVRRQGADVETWTPSSTLWSMR